MTDHDITMLFGEIETENEYLCEKCDARLLDCGFGMWCCSDCEEDEE